MDEPNPSGDTKPLSRGDLERLHLEGLLSDDAFVSALGHWDATRAWRSFASRWLTILGTVFLLVGVLFFFAYNWKELHRFTRFAILEGGVLLTALASAYTLRSDRHRLTGELLLIAAAVLTGILLAVYGQAYQTGADAFQNFLGWAALILPWVIVARSAALSILWLAILETGVIFFWTQVMGPTGGAGFGLLWVLLGLFTLAASFARETLARSPSFTWLAPLPLRYLLTTATLTWFGIAAVRFIFHDEFRSSSGVDALGFLLFAAVVGLAFWWHRLHDYDLGTLLLCALFAATLLVIALARFFFDVGDAGSPAIWLLLALCTLGIYGGAGFGLQQIHRASREAPLP
ncbi:MAG: DUF2157 domain-containing protein [Verrucomicrobiales bacterium]